MMSQLNAREKAFLVTGCIFLSIILFYFLLVLPYLNSLDRLDNQIALRSQQLVDVRSLSNRYLSLRKNVDRVQALLNQQQDFSTLTFIEGLVLRIAGRERLISMRPQPAENRDDFEIEAIEIKLEKLNLRELLEILWAIEDSTTTLKVEKLYLKQRFDNQAQLDTTMIITAIRRTK